VENNAWITVRAVDDFAAQRDELMKSSRSWWPDIGPLGDTRSFAFTYRMDRLGPITILESDFHSDVWVNGGELRPHYHVTLPAAVPSATLDQRATTPDTFQVYLPEGKRRVRRYLGRRLAVMIDRDAVENALADALGRALAAQVDFQPKLPTTTPTTRTWIRMAWLLAEHLFSQTGLLRQPFVATPYIDSVVRGFLMAADHPYRPVLERAAVPPPPRIIRSAIDIIEAEADQPLTVSALAARSFVSVRSLQQGFRAHVGTTPMAYLREVRLRRAREDLLESDPSIETVASIAFRWGFTHLGRFAAAYAARYGENPSTTRQRAVKRFAK
jgi:AraC-like DNA-binding protein